MLDAISIFTFFVLIVYPISLLCMILYRTYKSMMFLRTYLIFRFSFSKQKLDAIMQIIIWSLRDNYNAYDFYFSKMFEVWSYKIDEVLILEDKGLQRELGGIFLRIFFARIIGNSFVELRLGSILLHKLYISNFKNIIGDDIEKISKDEASEEYINDLKKIREMIDSKPSNMNDAKLLIDDWIECNSKPVYALPHNFLCHLFILNNILRLYPPMHLKWVPIIDEPMKFNSFRQFMSFGIIVYFSSHWRRFWFPIAYFCYLKFPSMLNWIMVKDSKIINQIVKSGIDNSPDIAFKIFATSVLPINPYNR